MKSSLEFRRKLFHIISLLLWIIPILGFPVPITLLLFLLVIGINTAVVFKYRPIYRLLAWFIDNFERDVNLDRPGIQALYANLGIFLSYLIFGTQASVAGVIVLAVGDGFSTLVGYHIGRRKLFYNPSKSIEGLTAFFIASFIALLLYTETHKALLVSAFSSIVESLPLRIDDNFTVPLTGSLIYYLV